jgi:hypothetical protein
MSRRQEASQLNSENIGRRKGRTLTVGRAPAADVSTPFAEREPVPWRINPEDNVGIAR